VLHSARSSWAALPAGASGAISRGIGSDQPAYFAQRGAGGTIVLRNTTQHLDASLSRGAVVLSGAQGARFALSAPSIGRTAASTTPLFAAAQITRNHVTFASPMLSEWFANGPAGVEQGFTVATRPSGAGPLEITQTLARGVQATVNAAGDGVVLRTAHGSLTYTGLTVTDATGARVPALLAARGHRLIITVRDARVVYPLRIDPVFVQSAELTLSNPYGDDFAGDSVAISGSTIVVGAPDSGADEQGAVYVYSLPSTGGWQDATQTAVLVPSDAEPFDALGYSVAISGSTIVAGAPDQGYDGAVYVWSEPDGGWTGTPADPLTQTAELATPDPYADWVGGAVAVSGSTVFAGNVLGGDVFNLHKYHHDGGDGYLYVWTMPSGGWATAPDPMDETADLAGPQNTFNRLLGNSVAASGSTFAAGNPDDGGDGEVDVWSEPAGGWAGTLDNPLTPTAVLTATDSYAVGDSVALSGGTLVSGDPENYDDAGAVYVWSEPATGWASTDTPAAQLAAADGAPDSGLGFSVAVDGGTVVAGSPDHNDELGQAYVWSEPAVGGWAGAADPLYESEDLTADDGDYGDEFGGAVALDGSTIVAGAPGHEPNGGVSGEGAGYVFHPDVAGLRLVVGHRPAILANGTAKTTVTLTVTDSDGAPVSGDDVTFTSSGGQQIGPVTPGAAPGTYQAVVTATRKPGDYTITATDTTVADASTSTQLVQLVPLHLLSVRTIGGSLVVLVHVPYAGSLDAIATHADGTLIAAAASASLPPGHHSFVFARGRVAASGPGSFTFTLTLTPTADGRKLLTVSAHPHLHLLIVFTARGGGIGVLSRTIRF
jgi:hypothetical protein